MFLADNRMYGKENLPPHLFQLKWLKVYTRTIIFNLKTGKEANHRRIGAKNWFKYHWYKFPLAIHQHVRNVAMSTVNRIKHRKTTRRKFLCTPQDLAQFSIKFYGFIDIENGVTQEVLVRRLLIQAEDHLREFGLKPDAVTTEAYDVATTTFSIADLHYALHHVYFQLWWSAKNGIIFPKKDRLASWERITEDCIQE